MVESVAAALPKQPLAAPKEPVRLTAATQIYHKLRRLILDMKLVPGAPLNDRELTELYGVSRTPVREALIRLAEEGLVSIQPQAGTRVGRIPLDALPDAVMVRRALECAIIRDVVAKASEGAIADLGAIINRQQAMATLRDEDGFHLADEAFHEMLADVSGHPGVWRVAQQAKTQIDRCRRMTLPTEGRMQNVILEHARIVEAITMRDAAAAEAAMTEHLIALLPDAAKLRSEFPDYFT